MELYRNGIKVSNYEPLYSNKKIIISIDSSKTNSAIIVGDTMGHILDDFEIKGGGNQVDVHDLCRETRAQLKNLFHGADILLVGIEDIITKKEKGYKGIEIHQSRLKITTVWNNFIFFFDEFFGIMPVLVNNWAWKSGVLPEKYRTKDHDKGSKDWFKSLGNQWADRSDDVTDAVCIFLYLRQTMNIKPVYEIKEIQPPTHEYEIALYPDSLTISDKMKVFEIVNNETLEHNLGTMSNMLDINQIGCVKVPIESIPIEWIYSDALKYSAQCNYERETDWIYIVIGRKV